MLFILTAAAGYSQAVNATLLGTITDASGGAVPNAKVTITETNTSVSRSTATNESGNYVFS
ncbi:MAG TPA: carboxypeptidase-like regulatory domain-containing protein, partial [Bryobacterales bacterium]|nr:carboxypeptidase-like regulatory domain-containing protein [Bryobacterales bacterium]